MCLRCTFEIHTKAKTTKFFARFGFVQLDDLYNYSDTVVICTRTETLWRTYFSNYQDLCFWFIEIYNGVKLRWFDITQLNERVAQSSSCTFQLCPYNNNNNVLRRWCTLQRDYNVGDEALISLSRAVLENIKKDN